MDAIRWSGTGVIRCHGCDSSVQSASRYTNLEHLSNLLFCPGKDLSDIMRNSSGMR